MKPVKYRSSYFQDMLDPFQAIDAIESLIPKARHLRFEPKSNFHVMARFQNLLSHWCEENDVILDQIESFGFSYPCNFATRKDEVDIYGFGGTILQVPISTTSHLRRFNPKARLF